MRIRSLVSGSGCAMGVQTGLLQNDSVVLAGWSGLIYR